MLLRVTVMPCFLAGINQFRLSEVNKNAAARLVMDSNK